MKNWNNDVLKQFKKHFKVNIKKNITCEMHEGGKNYSTFKYTIFKLFSDCV